MVGARERIIAWAREPWRWHWISRPDSRFREVAKLKAVCWLDIRGRIESQMLSTGTTYAAFLVFKIAEEHYGIEKATSLIRFVNHESDGEAKRRAAPVHLVSREGMNHPAEFGGKFPKMRTDGWMEVELGNFYIGTGDEGQVEARLTEIIHDGKSGLTIEGIEFRPDFSQETKKMGEIDNGMSSPFQFLPEDCVSNIISLTSPQDACGASVISVGFKSASESDTVWEKFLPSDYKEIISNSVSPLNYATKKHLYFHLCHSPILINNGKLSFWISKSTGKKCYMLPARELCIAWKDTPRYWSWTSLPESRFPEVAELVDVCWLDIRGNMPTRLLSLKTNYAAYLVFKTTENSYGLEAVAKASVSFAAATTGTSSSSAETSDVFEPEGDSIDGRVPRQRNDGWQELLLGEFLNDEGDGDIDIKVSETKILNSKRGLILEGIELRPKEEV
ncbi:unnamed protein product [Coffea canephora]|uniref:F-box domain-containing protein n=1 Tax=Coffea canephora TaxID=49390 RepID=A0A068TTX4_COFCA|nr:unnamed protein product [Coffea canephora]